jgi:hypothetical protein
VSIASPVVFPRLSVLACAFAALSSPCLAAPAAAGGRQAELTARAKVIKADIAALRKRLDRIPASIDQVRVELTKVAAAKGINPTGIIFGPIMAVQALAENRKFDQGEGNAFDALTAFSRDLQQRGVDLMVVPYPTHAETYGHRLVKGVKPEDELWPAKVEGLIKLLESNVEVVDVGDAFKSYKGPGRVLGPFDHHFDAAGIDIIAKELARRIRNRYDFAKEGAAGQKLFTRREIQLPAPQFFLSYNGISANEAKPLNIPATLPFEEVSFAGPVNMGAKIDPVFLMGDSSVPFAGAYPKGAGMMPHLSAELGWLVPYTSDRGGGHKQCAWYARQHAQTVPQPRVLILVMVGYSLYFNEAFLGKWSIPPLPPLPSPAGANKAAASPFRAVVKLTKVSAPPDPKKTPYKEAYTVSEAEVTKLLGDAEGVKVGDTILLVEWVMKDRKMMPEAMRLRSGVSRTVGLSRWEKQTNASDEDTRMIVDDTENFDAAMYWVGDR